MYKKMVFYTYLPIQFLIKKIEI